jgi:hypothetical protein
LWTIVNKAHLIYKDFVSTVSCKAFFSNAIAFDSEEKPQQ